MAVRYVHPRKKICFFWVSCCVTCCGLRIMQVVYYVVNGYVLAVHGCIVVGKSEEYK